MTRYWVLIFFCFLALLFIHFYMNGNAPIRIWDEAIYANNAIEMHENREFFILENKSGIQLYNTKPPLAIWLQSLAIAVFGINEWAIRLPTFLSLIGIVLGLMTILKRYERTIQLPVFVILILLTSPGFMGSHVGRTGDLDALLTLWTTLFSLLFIDFLINETDRRSGFRIWVLGFIFLCGFMTKSTAMFLILPGLFLCLVVSKKVQKLFLSGHTILVCISCVLCIGLYYIYMNSLVPNYFQKVWFSEIERFYKNIMPWHEQPWYFYFKNLMDRFWPWVIVWIPLFVIGLKSQVRQLRLLCLYSGIHSILYLLFISIPAVKLEW